MEIVDRGIVFKGEEGTDHQSCAFPGVCALPSGRWIANCRRAPTKQATVGEHPLISRSDDQGKTWSTPVNPFPFKFELKGRNGGFRKMAPTVLQGNRLIAAVNWVDRTDPDLPLFNEETEGVLDMRVFLSISEDGGETWSESKLADLAPFDIPTPITGPILAFTETELACQVELNKHYLDTTPWRHSSVLLFSHDGGKSWPEHSIVTSDPANRFFYWDQRPGIIRNDAVLDLFWTFDRQEAVYLNIHARLSADRGRTWGELWDTGVPGQPAPPVPLSSGRLAMVYVDRTNEPVIKCRLSTDGGRTWPEDTQLLLHGTDLETQTWKKQDMKDAWAEMGEFSVGLPDTAPLSGDEFLAVYYAGPRTDLTDVHWVRVTV